MLLVRYAVDLLDLKRFLEDCLSAGIVRCGSPERKGLCDAAATAIWWNDADEWYPTCSEHCPDAAQWSGFREFDPHEVELPVIPDRALAWLDTQSGVRRRQIVVQRYRREP